MGRASQGRRRSTKQERRKRTAEAIKRAFDTAIVDYIEGRMTLEQLARRLEQFSDVDAVVTLERGGYRRVIVLLDAIGTVLIDPIHATDRSDPNYAMYLCDPLDDRSQGPYFQADLEAYYRSLRGSEEEDR